MSSALITVLISFIIVAGILLYNCSKNMGLPGFIVFMGIGLVLGDGYWGEPVYDNPQLTNKRIKILNVNSFTTTLKPTFKSEIEVC